MINQVPLTPGHHIATTPEELEYMVRALQSAPERGIDFETDGLRYAQGKKPIGYGLGFRPTNGGWPVCWYVPFGHRDPAPQANPEMARRAFNDALVGASAVIGANLKFELNMGRQHGYEIPQDAQLHDTMMQGFLAYEKRPMDLEYLSMNEGVSRWADPFELKNLVHNFCKDRAKLHRLPLEKDDKVERKQAYFSRFGHSEVPAALEAEYCCRDVSHSLCLDAKLRYKVQGLGTPNEAQRKYLYWNEMMLVRALAEIEFHGQMVDSDYLTDLGHILELDCGEREVELSRKFGVNIKWSSDSHVRDLLYVRYKFPVGKKTDGGRGGHHKQPAVDHEALLELQHLHPGIADLVEYKHRLKALQSFTYSLAWEVGLDGRIHPQFLGHGTAAGRLSCRSPNFQNLPKRHKELSKMIREAWKIDEGRVRIYADYSQVELRVMAHETQCRTFLNAYRSAAYDAYLAGKIDYDAYRWYRRSEPKVDVHADVARNQLHSKETDADWGTKRDAAKVINFGVPYGGGAALLVGDPKLRMPESEAKGYVAQYHRGNPEINQTRANLLATMRSRLGTPRFTNWAGLTVHGPRLNHWDEEVKAEEERSMFACLIQGSAGMLTRFSLVRWYQAYKAGTFPGVVTSTIHDEIQYDCDLADLPYCAVEAQRMQETFPYFGNVPIVVDLKVTTTDWSETHEYDYWAGAV